MRNIDLEAERQFENLKVTGNSPRDAQRKFYWATSIPNDLHLAETLRKIANSRVLEIGCSSGHSAEVYAPECDTFVGVDISDAAIKHSTGLGIQNASFYCIDAHKLPFDNEEFDFVIVNSLLHHLDLKISLQEISRVLKPGGELVFKEPLGTNPIFQLYRRLTPNSRTADERPFTFEDLRLIQEFFVIRSVRWFGFLSILSAFIKSSPLRWAFTRLDHWLSYTPLKYLFWQFCGFAGKRSH